MPPSFSVKEGDNLPPFFRAAAAQCHGGKPQVPPIVAKIKALTQGMILAQCRLNLAQEAKFNRIGMRLRRAMPMNKQKTRNRIMRCKITKLLSVCGAARNRHCFAMIFLFLAVNAMSITAQTSPSPSKSPTPAPPSLEKQFLKNILNDQKAIWTSPFRVRGSDAKWLVPFGVATAALVATDRRTSSWVSRNGSLPAVSRNVSLGGSTYATGGVAAGFYLVGRFTNNRKARETGLLATEALIDSGIVTQALKLATQRPRPNYDAGRGRFFTGGNSFPSGHATSVWSVATVIAYEYQDRPLVRYGAFAAATAVSLSRYTGRKHFLSDVLVGSAIGFGIGRFVYRKHHVEASDLNGNPPKTTKLMPTIIPLYNPRTRTYGGTLAWNF